MTLARNSKEVFSFGMNKVIHPAPPIKFLNPLLPLMAPNPAPVNINGKGSNFVVNHFKVVKAGLRRRYA